MHPEKMLRIFFRKISFNITFKPSIATRIFLRMATISIAVQPPRAESISILGLGPVRASGSWISIKNSLWPSISDSKACSQATW
jgi:hypothetical protein